MDDQAKLPPLDNPLREGDPDVGQGKEPITTANASESQQSAWWEELGFADEATAIQSYSHLRHKLSDQGRELSELRKTQTQANQPSGQSNTQRLLDITAEQFYENPTAALAQATKESAREVLSEFMQQQELERMIDEAAAREGVERWEIKDAYQSAQNDPRKTLEIVAAMAKMQRAGVHTDAIQQAAKETAAIKARATQVTSGSHVPEDTEPDWHNMDFQEMAREMAKRGMTIPESGG